MNKYETIMLLDSTISEENRNNAINKIIKYIEKKGKIEKTENLGKKQLAYEIRKNKEGYYYIIEFWANPKNITNLKKIYRITDEILKFIVVKQDN